MIELVIHLLHLIWVSILDVRRHLRTLLGRKSTLDAYLATLNPQFLAASQQSRKALKPKHALPLLRESPPGTDIPPASRTAEAPVASAEP